MRRVEIEMIWDEGVWHCETEGVDRLPLETSDIGSALTRAYDLIPKKIAEPIEIVRLWTKRPYGSWAGHVFLQ